jgi:pullulanase/glycogen debranching enzyme
VGSLRNYRIKDQNDNWVTGAELRGSGYTFDPQESINYASKHDNETLYDLNMFKLPLGHNGMDSTTMADRVRVQNMAISLVGLSQGIPFFHMASDMLRSKSLDRNSYDSGDWFNRVDFTYKTNNFGVGLPPAWNNESRWPIMIPLLENPDLKPQQSDILQAVNHFQEILRIRQSSKLFRLETAADIRKRINFYNLGSNQVDGLIAMGISDEVKDEADLDPNYKEILVFFNADKFSKSLSIPEFNQVPMVLHPIQANSHDHRVRQASFNQTQGLFEIPPRTTAIFALPQ